MRKTKSETIAELMKWIPKGSHDPMTRECLSLMLGMSDRKVRQAIHDARMEGHLIVSTDKGYYIPDDVADLVDYYRKERKRAISVLAALKKTRLTLREMGVDLK